MAPSSSQLGSSQNKRQQTISSFFARKPAAPKPAPEKAPPPAPSTSTAPIHEEHNEGSEEDEDDLPAVRPSATRRKRIIADEDEDEVQSHPAPKRVRSIAKLSADPLDESPTPRKSLGQASEAEVNSGKRPKASDRTSKFIFSSSPVVNENGPEENSAEAQKRKEKLHEKFVKKLGRPDSFAELRRKNKIISEETMDGDEGVEDEEAEAEEPPPKAQKGRKGVAAKKGGSKLTPMEKQYLDIKRKHLDTVIVMEVGYKFKFLGEDARIASKELGIVCIPGKFRYDERKLETCPF